jgi:hypothetical protein
MRRYAAESYPLTHREVGMSFAVQQNNFWAAVLGLTFPSVLSALGPSGTFYLYAGTNLLGQSPTYTGVKADEPAWVMCFLLQPETAYVPRFSLFTTSN